MHGVAYQYGAEQDPNSQLWVEYTLATKLDKNWNPTTEWTKTYTDSAGRQYKTIYSSAGQSNPCATSFYNEYGQLWESVDPDGVTNFFVYGNNGDLNQSQVQYTITALSANALAIPNYDTLCNTYQSLEGGVDRIKQTVRYVVPANPATGQPDLVRSDTFAWTNNESDNHGTLISSTETSADGLHNWNMQYADAYGNTVVTNQTHTGYSVPNRWVTNCAPNGACTVGSYAYGRLQCAIQYDSGNGQIGGTCDAYDAHGRLGAATDARNGTTSYFYNSADLGVPSARVRNLVFGFR